MAEFGLIVWRRKWVIFAVSLIVLLAASAIILSLTPSYVARSQIVIKPQNVNIVNVEKVLPESQRELDYVQTEVQRLRSPEAVRELVTRLRLDQNPEFNPALRPVKAPFWEEVVPPAWIATVQAWLRELGVADRAAPRPVSEAELQSKIADAVARSLTVTLQGRSFVAEMGFEAKNPVLAAQIVNTMMDIYIESKLQDEIGANQKAESWLNGRIGELRRELLAAEQAVEKFRDSSDLIHDGNSANVANQRLAELNTHLTQVQTQKADVEARLSAIEQLRRAGKISAAYDILRSPLIQALDQQQVDISRRLADLSGRYGPRSPELIATRTQLDVVQRRIGEEIEKIVGGLRSEVQIVSAREAALMKDIDAQKARIMVLNGSQIQLRALQSEVAANDALLKEFLSRSKELKGLNDASSMGDWIVSRADAPTQPAFPNTVLLFVVSATVALFCGLGAAFAVEMLDGSYRSVDQIEADTGLQALGLVPKIQGLRMFRPLPIEYLRSKPTSAFGGALQLLYTRLNLCAAHGPGRVILVTSTLPDEGKTSTALALAHIAGRQRRRVVLVDCDLWRPSVHRALSLPDKPGLADVLLGTHTLGDAIQTVERFGLDVIPAGAVPRNTPGLIDLQQMFALVGCLEQEYDLVILDSPPVLAVPDAHVLRQIAHQTIYAIRWASTRRTMVLRGLQQFSRGNGGLVELLLTQVDTKKHARYSFTDAGVYHGTLKRYYAD